MGWPGLFVALLSATGMVTGIGSIRYGSVADAMVIYATVPFVTAGVAFLLIGERTSRSTIIASLVALAGVVIMLLGSDWGGSMLGKGLAVLMTLSMAGFSVIMRGHRDLPMLPAMALSAWLCSAFCFSWASPAEISATRTLMLLRMAFGTCSRMQQVWCSTHSAPSAFRQRRPRFSLPSKCRSRPSGSGSSSTRRPPS
jgi:drug/metabolite transporter (DMT)-like permease